MESGTTQEKVLRPPADRAIIAKGRVGCKAFGNLAIGATGQEL